LFCTFKELRQFVEVAGGEAVEVLAGLDREDQDGGQEANGDANGHGGDALVRELDGVLHAVARHGHHREGQFEDEHAVVVPRLHLRDAPRERRRRRCRSSRHMNQGDDNMACGVNRKRTGDGR